MKKHIFKQVSSVSILILVCFSGYGQRVDTNYIEDYRQKLNIKLVAEYERSFLGVLDRPSNKTLLYGTNTPWPQYGISLTHRYVNVEYTTGIPGLSIFETGKQRTRNTSFAIGVTGRKIWFRNFMEWYRGFSLDNPANVFQANSNRHINRNDIEAFTVYGNLYYGFNGDRYSHRATIWQSEAQKRSAGSWVTGISWAYQSLNTEYSLTQIDPDNPSRFLPGEEEGRFTMIGLNVGYIHTYVWMKHFYLTLGFIPGISYVDSDLRFSEERNFDNNTSLGIHGEFRMVAGYNSKYFFCGVTGISYILTSPLNVGSTPIGNNFNYAKAFVGYRFKIRK